MLIDLHGLKISCIDDGRPPVDGADICWERRRCSALEPQAGTTCHNEDGWTHLVFAADGVTHCRFAISADGRHVVSQAIAGVRRTTLTALFAEAVMRVVFHRMAIVSFHGAALARDGAAIMVIGARGSGKSTLSGALVRNGWSLLADDLVRPIHSDSGWRLTPGYRQSKVLPDTAAALGYDPATLDPRWNIPHTPAMGNKLLVSYPAPALLEPVPLRLIYNLGPRRTGAAGPITRQLETSDRLQILMQHLSRGLGVPATPPTPAFASIVALLREIPIQSLAMPDSLRDVVSAGGVLSNHAADERNW